MFKHTVLIKDIDNSYQLNFRCDAEILEGINNVIAGTELNQRGLRIL